jgi:hypothetical protein
MLRIQTVSEHPIEIKNRSFTVQVASPDEFPHFVPHTSVQIGDHFVYISRVIKTKVRGERYYVVCTGTLTVG